MTMTATPRGETELTGAMIDHLRSVSLIDADGNEITGWGYERRPLTDDGWEDALYKPGVHWIFLSTSGDQPQVVAGAAYLNELGDPLLLKPLTEPFPVRLDGDTLSLYPDLRIFPR